MVMINLLLFVIHVLRLATHLIKELMWLPAWPFLRYVLSSSYLPPLTGRIYFYLKSGLGTHPNVRHKVLKWVTSEIHISAPTELCDKTRE